MRTALTRLVRLYQWMVLGGHIMHWIHEVTRALASGWVELGFH